MNTQIFNPKLLQIGDSFTYSSLATMKYDDDETMRERFIYLVGDVTKNNIVMYNMIGDKKTISFRKTTFWENIKEGSVQRSKVILF